MPDNLPNFKVKANEFEFSFDQQQIDNADVVAVGDDSFHIVLGGRSLNVKLIGVEESGKKMELEVEGEKYVIDIKDPLAQMLDTMGFNNAAARSIREIRAPMPGLVLDIAVEAGQEVNEGDRILILEAMKMENSICIHTKARIKKVNVSKGQAVDKNQVLVELDS
jgi:acetyl/propionyl-CoA carboxylase alpha subunit